jgi:hypothetical protein
MLAVEGRTINDECLDPRDFRSGLPARDLLFFFPIAELLDNSKIARRRGKHCRVQEKAGRLEGRLGPRCKEAKPSEHVIESQQSLAQVRLYGTRRSSSYFSTVVMPCTPLSPLEVLLSQRRLVSPARR